MRLEDLTKRINMMESDQLPKHCKAVIFADPDYIIPPKLMDLPRAVIVINDWEGFQAIQERFIAADYRIKRRAEK